MRGLWRRRVCLVAGLLITLSVRASGEHPPVRLYTMLDGLPRDAVHHLEFDSRGFLWVFAGEGVSRFDGVRFLTFSTDQGLPDERVHDLLETRSGDLWFATSRGLCRFKPRGPAPLCTVFNPDDSEQPTAFTTLLEDEKGIWCGTRRGLYFFDPSAAHLRFRAINLGIPANTNRTVTALLKDRQGALWVATEESGIFRIGAGNGVERYTTHHGLPASVIASLFEDRDGTLWAGTRQHSPGGLCRLVRDPDPARPIVERTYGRAHGLKAEWVTDIYQTRDGTLWTATTGGLHQFVPPTGRAETGSFSAPVVSQLCDREVWRVAEDRSGNLWVASNCGLIRISRNGFTTFSTEDGLSHPAVNSIFETRGGDLVVVNPSATIVSRALNRFDGRRFVTIVPRLPSQYTNPGWGWYQTIIEDRQGSWWVPTGVNAILRFPSVSRLEALASVAPAAVYPLQHGTVWTEAFRVYQDGHGDVWIAVEGPRKGLMKWERRSDSMRDITAQTGLPGETLITFFAEDRAGHLWAGTWDAGLLRYKDGRFTHFSPARGAPRGWILSMHVDGSGRLWVASGIDGLIRIDEPAADNPQFVRHTTAHGLSSNNVRSVTEDKRGRIYAGTGRGVDRLDPSTGRVRHFTVEDGLPKGPIDVSYRDKEGHLWFGSGFGVSRFIPPIDAVPAPPSIYITEVTVAGAPPWMSGIGEIDMSLDELRRDQNSITLQYLGLSPNVGDRLLYQHRADGGDWSAPTDQRTVHYANLTAGAYRFLVRAIDSEGNVSPRPAALSFVIPPPIWMRGWFMMLAAAALGAALYGVHRYRVRSILAITGVRTRIATDLHDDIGTNLTRIAVLSEVARQGTSERTTKGRLDSIARISRESVSAMSDIVWAINPERDGLLNLVRRMRQHASEVFSAADIVLHFDAPETDRTLKLDADIRRDFFLIFKEAVNNAARHSACTRVNVECRADAGHVSLRIADNGSGFDTTTDSEGQGIVSMRRRAKQMGASLAITSRSSEGTIVHLRTPLKRHHRSDVTDPYLQR